MATVEERVSSLEARVDAHAVGLNDLRQAVVHLEERMDRRFSALEAQFEARFTGVEARFAGFDARFTGFDQRLSALAASLDTKIDHLTSIVVWAFAAILTAVSALTVGLLLQ